MTCKFFNINHLFFLLLIATANAQNDSIKSWINKSTLTINRTNFELDSVFFEKNLKDEFSKVKVFGFGEASHQHKEFFEVKTSFFKYLVINYNVKYFFLEESIGTAYKIDKYINGQEFDLKKIMVDFRQSIWETEEMYSLIQWIKNYNLDKDPNDRVRFYGIDTMFNYYIDQIITQELLEEGVYVPQNISDILRSLSNEDVQENRSELKVKENEIRILKEFIENCKVADEKRNILNYALLRLTQYYQFLANPSQVDRDKFMADNIEFIANKKIKDANFFVWAHNEHIKKTKLIQTNITTIGNWLKQKFGDLYYSVGFGFGIGECKGVSSDGIWQRMEIKQPFKKTFSESLYEADKDIYFFDFKKALSNRYMNTFLNTKTDIVVIGGRGITEQNQKYIFSREKPIEAFDAFVFLKKISLSTPLKE